MNQKSAIRSLCISGLIAAVYAAATMALPMLSYGPIQLRFSEALTVLPFFLPEAIPGLAIGCALANLLSAYGIVDVVFGTLATLLAALWTAKLKNPMLAPLPPVISNMVIVGGMIAWYETSFGPGFTSAWLYNGITVGIGEVVACYVLGTVLLFALPKVPAFRQLTSEERLALIADRSAKKANI